MDSPKCSTCGDTGNKDQPVFQLPGGKTGELVCQSCWSKLCHKNVDPDEYPCTGGA